MCPHQMMGSHRASTQQTRPWNQVNGHTPPGRNPTSGTSTTTDYNPKMYPTGYPCNMYPSSRIPQGHSCPQPIPNCTGLPLRPNPQSQVSPLSPYLANSLCQLDNPSPPNRTCPPKSSYPLNSQYPRSQSFLTGQYTQGLTYSHTNCTAVTASPASEYSRVTQCVQNKSSRIALPAGVPTTMAKASWNTYQQNGTCSPTYQIPKRSAKGYSGSEIPPAKKVRHDTNDQPYSVQVNGIQEGMHIQGQYYLTVSSTSESQKEFSTGNSVASIQMYNPVKKHVPAQYVQGHLTMSATPVLPNPQGEKDVDVCFIKDVNVKKYQRMVYAAVRLAGKYVPRIIPALKKLTLKYKVLCLSSQVIRHLLNLVKGEEEIKVLKVYLRNKLTACRIANSGRDCPICQHSDQYDNKMNSTNRSPSSLAKIPKPVFPAASQIPDIHGVTSGVPQLSAASTIGKPDSVTSYKPNGHCNTDAPHPPQVCENSNAIPYANEEGMRHSNSPDISNSFLSESEFRDQPFESRNKITIDSRRNDSQKPQWRGPQNSVQNSPMTNVMSSVSSMQTVFPPMSNVQRPPGANFNPSINSVPSTQNAVPPLNHFHRSSATTFNPPRRSLSCMQNFSSVVNHTQNSPPTSVNPHPNSAANCVILLPPQNYMPRQRGTVSCSAQSLSMTPPTSILSSYNNLITSRGMPTARRPMPQFRQSLNHDQQTEASKCLQPAVHVGTVSTQMSDQAFRKKAALLMKLPETKGDKKPAMQESGMFSCFSLKPFDRNKNPLQAQVAKCPPEASSGMLLPHRIKTECIVIEDSDDDEAEGTVDKLRMQDNPKPYKTKIHTKATNSTEAEKGVSCGHLGSAGSQEHTDDTVGQVLSADSVVPEDNSTSQVISSGTMAAVYHSTCQVVSSGSVVPEDTSIGQVVSSASDANTNKTSVQVETRGSETRADNTTAQVETTASEIRADNTTAPVVTAGSEIQTDNSTSKVETTGSQTGANNPASVEEDSAVQEPQNSSLPSVNQHTTISNSGNAADTSDNCLQASEERDTLPLSEALKQLDDVSLDSLVDKGEAAFTTFVFDEGVGELEITTAEFGEDDWKKLMRG